jgi:hypothetical protein
VIQESQQGDTNISLNTEDEKGKEDEIYPESQKPVVSKSYLESHHSSHSFDQNIRWISSPGK